MVRLLVVVAVVISSGCQLVFPLSGADANTPTDAGPDADDGSVPVGRCSTVDFLADDFAGNVLDGKWIRVGGGSVNEALLVTTSPNATIAQVASQELYYLTESTFAVDLDLQAALPADCHADVELEAADGRTYGVRVSTSTIEGREFAGQVLARGSAMYTAGPSSLRIAIAHTAGRMTWEVHDGAANVLLTGQTNHDDPGLVTARLQLTCGVDFTVQYDNAIDPLATVPVSCPIQSLVDEFDTRPDVGPSWHRSNFIQCAFTFDGQARATIPSDPNGFCSLFASSIYDLHGGSFGVEVDPDPAQRVELALFLDGHGSQVGFALEAGTLQALTFDTNVAFNSAPFIDQRFWRLRGTATTLFFETSATGAPGTFDELAQTSDAAVLAGIAKASPRLRVRSAAGETRFERVGPFP